MCGNQVGWKGRRETIEGVCEGQKEWNGRREVMEGVCEVHRDWDLRLVPWPLNLGRGQM